MTGRRITHIPSRTMGKSFRGVQTDRLRAALLESDLTRAGRDVVNGIASYAGAFWQPMSYAVLLEQAGLSPNSRRTLVLQLPLILAGDWVERRPDQLNRRAFEFRVAERFHARPVP